MYLVTAVEGKGLRIGIVKEISRDAYARLPIIEGPSESFMRFIASEVEDWSEVQKWYVCTEGESFTSLRGLITLVNILAPLHKVPVLTFTESPLAAHEANLPIEPSYHMEPNITL